MGDPESARMRIESLVALPDVVTVSSEDLVAAETIHCHELPLRCGLSPIGRLGVRRSR